MRFKFNKDIEYFLKNFFLSEKYLLKKRLLRAIKNNYEDEISLLHKLVNNETESIDIGVYRGVYSYKLSKLSKHVHSFEPNPLIYPYLEKNLKKIIKNMSFYNLALSDKEIETNLKIPIRSNVINKNNYEEKFKLGCATIHNNNKLMDDKYSNYKVKTKKLDNILINKNIGFIKIDVEGHEKNVIIGAENIIKKNKPNLLIEIEEKHTKEKVENVINFINDFGYKSYYCENNNIISTSKLENLNKKNNFIFMP